MPHKPPPHSLHKTLSKLNRSVITGGKNIVVQRNDEMYTKYNKDNQYTSAGGGGGGGGVKSKLFIIVAHNWIWTNVCVMYALYYY